MRLITMILLVVAMQPAAKKVNPKDGAVLVRISAGEFTMGNNHGNGDEAPEHRVNLNEYWIYRTPVTVAQYRRFCKATKRNMPPAPSWGWKNDHPIVNVSWADAKAYADWAAVFLPSEEQWEKAARGTDGRKYPWGNAWDPTKCHWNKDREFGTGGTVPVGSYPKGASPYGVLDMVGAVWHWTSSPYTKDHSSEPIANAPHVARGSGWGENNPEELRVSRRSGEGIWQDQFYGFRCVSRPGPPRTLAPRKQTRRM